MVGVEPALGVAPAPAPRWPSDQALAEVTAELATRAPLVRFADCAALRGQLARVAQGEAMAVQAGDCAELFGEVTLARTRRKAAQLRELAELVRKSTGLPTVPVGRLAGQFAKPRSAPMEMGPDGESLPAYRGDAVNSVVPTAAARTPDPRRMLTAYDRSADVLAGLARTADAGTAPIYTSHEALLLEYEAALVREDRHTGQAYGSSAHLLWVGERTRQVDSPHIDLIARVANPIAVKLGPSADPADVAGLVERLDPDRRPGRLTLIARLGVDEVAERLPGLVRAVQDTGVRPAWLCDPMHGNTIRAGGGVKTRAVRDVVAEAVCFARILRELGAHPGGLHLESTPDEVTECVTTREEAADGPYLPRYRSACDPRLNPHQTRHVLHAFTAAMAGH
jgi:3-deoxy-7-phosphoheptulonate synthase